MDSQDKKSRERRAELAQAAEWLRHTLGMGDDDGRLGMETNADTTDILLRLYRQNKRKDAHLTAVEADLQSKLDEYAGEGQRLDALLRMCGLDRDNMRSASRQTLRTLARIACALGCSVGRTNHINMGLALRRCKRESQQLSDAMGSVQQDIDRLQHEVDEAKQALERYRSFLRDMVDKKKELEAVQPSLIEQCTFLEKKSKSYERQLAEKQNELLTSGYTQQLDHRALLELAERVYHERERLEPFERKLTAFQDLPKDVDLAHVALAERRQTLAAVNAKLQALGDSNFDLE